MIGTINLVPFFRINYTVYNEIKYKKKGERS